MVEVGHSTIHGGGRVGSVETVRIEERETEDMRVIMLWWMGV